jgi:L-2-hydroxyglutarate oxidase LhgO
MHEKSDVLIIGAGIVGLATAYQIAQRRPSWRITVLEKEDRVAAHQTGHNSGVIHSGIYYKPGSLKAQNCLEGKRILMQFCTEQGIPFHKLGKVILATRQNELSALDEIERRGRAHQIPGLERMGIERLREIEPHAVALSALWVPECHVVDYTTVALALASVLQKAGVRLVLRARAHDMDKGVVETSQGAFAAPRIINCAGLHSDTVARMTLAVPHQIIPFRGEYYQLAETKRSLVRGLIYPVPDPRFPFLGVHLTRLVDGTVEAGPNAVLALAKEGYRKSDFSAADCWRCVRYPGFWNMTRRYWQAGCYEWYRSLSKKAFLRDLRRLVPSIDAEDLLPGGAGVRAQVVTREGKLLDDFSLLCTDGAVHVLNAPSPAATASFSIGKTIAEKVLA